MEVVTYCSTAAADGNFQTSDDILKELFIFVVKMRKRLN